MPVTAVYIVLLFLGVGVTCYLFLTRGIENNTVPAIRLSMVMLLGTGAATAGYFTESSNIKNILLCAAGESYSSVMGGIKCSIALRSFGWRITK